MRNIPVMAPRVGYFSHGEVLLEGCRVPSGHHRGGGARVRPAQERLGPAESTMPR